MKKLFSFVAAMAISAGAYTLNLHSGWQLKGALSDINVSKFNNSNIISVWTYNSNNQKWKAYLPNSSINLSQYGIENLQEIKEGEGFWINASSATSFEVSNYPITEKIGTLWGYDWYKIDAFYDNDQRYSGNDVELYSDNEYIVIRAYKKDNQDSRAQVSAPVPNVKGFSAKVNLVTDNIYSKFQAFAISKRNIDISENIGDITNDSNLTFIAGININVDKISCWYEIEDPLTNKYYEQSLDNQTYDENLTSLVDNGSDVKVEIAYNDENLTYRVYSENNDSIIFEKTLNLDTTKMTNFNGFNIVSFRSRVRDDAANQNGYEAIDKSENIIKDFNVTVN